MARTISVMTAVIALAVAGGGAAAGPQGHAQQGVRLFGACAACHSLTPDQNMTGPSLAGVWGREAGTLASFERYSPALKTSGVVWDEATLDKWLESPSRFIPDNHMTFAGIPNAQQRADVIAFLKEASSGHSPAAGGRAGGMMGGMGSPLKDLKKLGPDRQVRAIRLCHDNYVVTTADGKTADFWEPNLRFETDSSGLGPPAGTPVIMPAGMMGDRASVIFATPAEISALINTQCQP